MKTFNFLNILFALLLTLNLVQSYDLTKYNCDDSEANFKRVHKATIFGKFFTDNKDETETLNEDAPSKAKIATDAYKTAPTMLLIKTLFGDFTEFVKKSSEYCDTEDRAFPYYSKTFLTNNKDKVFDDTKPDEIFKFLDIFSNSIPTLSSLNTCARKEGADNSYPAKRANILSKLVAVNKAFGGQFAQNVKIALYQELMAIVYVKQNVKDHCTSGGSDKIFIANDCQFSLRQGCISRTVCGANNVKWYKYTSKNIISNSDKSTTSFKILVEASPQQIYDPEYLEVCLPNVGVLEKSTYFYEFQDSNGKAIPETKSSNNLLNRNLNIFDEQKSNKSDNDLLLKPSLIV